MELDKANKLAREIWVMLEEYGILDRRNIISDDVEDFVYSQLLELLKEVK